MTDEIITSDDEALSFDDLFNSQQLQAQESAELCLEDADHRGMFLIGPSLREKGLKAINKILSDSMADYNEVVKATAMLERLEKLNLMKIEAVLAQQKSERTEEFNRQKHQDKMEASDRDYQLRLQNAKDMAEYRKLRLGLVEKMRAKRLEHEAQQKALLYKNKNKNKMEYERLQQEKQLRLENLRSKEEIENQKRNDRLKIEEDRKQLQLTIQEKRFEDRRVLMQEQSELIEGRSKSAETDLSAPIQITFTNAMKEITDAGNQSDQETSQTALPSGTTASEEPEIPLLGKSEDNVEPTNQRSTEVGGGRRKDELNCEHVHTEGDQPLDGQALPLQHCFVDPADLEYE